MVNEGLLSSKLGLGRSREGSCRYKRPEVIGSLGEWTIELSIKLSTRKNGTTGYGRFRPLRFKSGPGFPLPVLARKDAIYIKDDSFLRTKKNKIWVFPLNIVKSLLIREKLNSNVATTIPIA